MVHRIVILGGGTGGTLTANRLTRMLPDNVAEITVVDENDDHIYQPGLLFVPFGLKRAEELVRSRRHQLHSGIIYHQSAIDHVDISEDRVILSDGTALVYDVLIVASGAALLPQETEGMLGPSWNSSVFTFYSIEGAQSLARKLAQFDGGRLVVNIVDMPIKCPVAPLEFCFLADWYFRKNGKRDRIELTYVTPLDGAFTKPMASKLLGGMLEEKGINLVSEFNTGEVDGTKGELVGYDGRTVTFDLAVVVPVHGGAEYVGRSEGLGDDLNFIPTDEHTLQSRVQPNIFAIGDATNVPTSKAGSVTHFEGDVLCKNVGRFHVDNPGVDPSQVNILGLEPVTQVHALIRPSLRIVTHARDTRLLILTLGRPTLGGPWLLRPDPAFGSRRDDPAGIHRTSEECRRSPTASDRDPAYHSRFGSGVQLEPKRG
jgi:sulfide:quinone oxidoreductase